MDQELLRYIERSIPKHQLIDGGYYAGKCRNARIARWNQCAGLFVHWRFKFGIPSLETIQHPADAVNNRLDYFAPFIELQTIVMEIPYSDGNMTRNQRTAYLKWEQDVALRLPAWAS